MWQAAYYQFDTSTVARDCTINWKGKFFHRKLLNAGVLKLFCIRPFPNIFKISATLKWYKLQQTYSNKVIQVDFGDPREAFGDPKKGRDPQFENRCLRCIKFIKTGFKLPMWISRIFNSFELLSVIKKNFEENYTSPNVGPRIDEANRSYRSKLDWKVVSCS